MDRLRARAVKALRLVFAAGFALAALFHAAAIVRPTIAEPSPAWRHGLFVAINLGVALGFVFRPWWFVWVFAALTVQQLWGHGTYAVEVWTREHRLDWASVVVLAAMPVGLYALLRKDVRRMVAP